MTETDPATLKIVNDATAGLPRETLAGLLDDIRAHITRFIGFGSDHASVAVALWVAHCYVVESAPMAAYLRVRSAAEESGKSTLLEVLHQLLRSHGINAVSVSPSVVYRLREKVGPVALLLDETDNGLAKRQDDSARDLLAIVNAGYRRSATVYRTEGRSFEPRAFKCFGPAAIAGIGYLEPTTESRCIPTIMPRAPRGTLKRFIGFKVEPAANRLADRLDAWATPEVVDALRDASPSYPAELRDRHVEVWWNLLAIADLAGEGWPGAARAAALALHVGDEDESGYSVGVLLLAHAERAFDEAETDRLPTAKLLDLLASNEEGPWGNWWGAELNRDGPPRAAAADLARKLKAFPRSDGKPIKPRVIKLPDGSTARGYLREDFEAAWVAYLGFGSPHVTDVTDVTPLASTVTSVTSVTSPTQTDKTTSIDRRGTSATGTPTCTGWPRTRERAYPRPRPRTTSPRARPPSNRAWWTRRGGAMNEHQMIGIRPRPEIGKGHDHWHEVGCSCGWSAKYPSAYRARLMHDRHVNRELERTGTWIGEVGGRFFWAQHYESLSPPVCVLVWISPSEGVGREGG